MEGFGGPRSQEWIGVGGGGRGEGWFYGGGVESHSAVLVLFGMEGEGDGWFVGGVDGC